ncbi:hypothetical protein LINPERHAP2_LOCUS3433 [Linum perenne]
MASSFRLCKQLQKMC